MATAKDYKLIRSKSGDLNFFDNFINVILPFFFILGGIYIIDVASRMCENIIHL
jgi:hypothetical protein